MEGSVKEETGLLSFEDRSHSYSLFLPQRGTAHPRSALVFLHGFTRDHTRHKALAWRLCNALGIAVLLPDLPSLLGPSLIGYGESSRDACVRGAVHAASWLAGRLAAELPREAAPSDAGVVSLVLGGYSAGGAVAFEAARDLQAQGQLQPAGLLLIDAVPWTRTKLAAKELADMPGGVLLLESEPSSFNMHGAFQLQVISELRRVAQRPESLRVLTVAGSNHLDAENAGCQRSQEDGEEAARRQNYQGWLSLSGWLIGRSIPERQEAFYAAAVEFLAEATGSPSALRG
eukprot:TRINITY_DN11926_c0_g1_i1.p1 TRINITY_DN11926_c0_g1~~TRINITY_DN11926_c0_g1_i1.p1  ORF type:complete len:288 (+),score=38.92 TRINITY_DN11926_c0_g1_i1:71-934(+)